MSKKIIAIGAMLAAVAGIALAGYDAGLITVATLPADVSLTAITATVTPTTNFVDMSKFVGPVKFVCHISTNMTGATGTITPVLQSVSVTASNGAVTATNVVTTGMTTVTNGPAVFTVKLEKGAFVYRYARMVYTVVNTDTSTWSAVSQIIGFTK